MVVPHGPGVNVLRHLLPLLLLGGSAACGGPPPGSGSDTASSGGGEEETAATIYGVRTGAVDQGSLTLEGVVATSGLTRDGAGFYIQDLGGGPLTGLYVFVQQGAQDLDELAPGDVLRLKGRVGEVYGRLELTLEDDADLTVIGSAEPVADTLPATASADELAPYGEGLVTLEAPSVAACPDLLGHIDLEGEAEWGDAFVSVLAGPGDELEALTGVLDTALARYAVHPRAEEDIAGEPTGAGCSTTVAELNQSEIEGGVILEEVVATSGLSRLGEGFFVQDPGGGPHSGVFVSLGWLPAGHGLSPEAGQVMALRGTALTWEGRRQVALTSADALWVIGEDSPTAEVLSEPPEDWSPWVGALLTLEDLVVTSPAGSDGQAETSYEIDVDDLLASVRLESGESYASLTGPLFLADEELLICPRSSDDVGEAGGSSAVDTTVAELHSGAFEEGLAVRLSGAVATSGLSLDGGTFALQDAGGGEDSGIVVVLDLDGGESPEVFPGDLLDLQATLSRDPSGRHRLHLTAEYHLSMVGSEEPSARVFTEAPEDWSPWHDALVSLHSVTVSTTEGDEPTTSWGMVLDTRYVELALSDGREYGEVTGLLHVDPDGAGLRLAPRTAFDLKE